MAIKGKKLYQVYLTPECYEAVKDYIEGSGPGSGGISGLLDHHLCSLAHVVKNSGLKPGQKVTFAKFLRMVKEGINR